MPTTLSQSMGRLEGQAIPQRFVFVDEDFVNGPVASTTDDAAPFKLVGTSAALTLESESFGVGALLSNTTNVASLQSNSDTILIQENGQIVFEAKLSVEASADTAWLFVGLGAANADPFATSFPYAVGFWSKNDSGTLRVTCSNNSSGVPGTGTNETDETTGITLTDGQEYRLQIVIDGNKEARFYVDGVLTNKITSNLPTSALGVNLSTKGAAARQLNIDYVVGWQDVVR